MSYHQLIESHVGACINEVLRLYTVLPFLVKTVPTSSQQTQAYEKEGHVFTANGASYRVPGGTMVMVNTTAAHINPEHWPNSHPNPYQFVYRTSPIDAFDPDHWITGGNDKQSDQKPRFSRPKLGTYFPFSDGNRGCLGKKLALVELRAIVTRIFAEYSVDLVAETKEGWQKARDDAAKLLTEDVKIHMSLRFVVRSLYDL